MFASWYNLSMLTMESQQAIWLRLIKLSLGGPKAHAEAQLMVSEKLDAASAAAGSMMMGASADSVVRTYRRKVRANVRRLSK